MIILNQSDSRHRPTVAVLLRASGEIAQPTNFIARSILLIKLVLVFAACSCHTTSLKQDDTDSGFKDAETRAQSRSTDASVSDSISDASSQDDGDLDTMRFDDALVGNLDASPRSDSTTVNPIESGVDDSSSDADRTIQDEYLDTVEGNDYQQVSVGWGHACALRTDHTIIC